MRGANSKFCGRKSSVLLDICSVALPCFQVPRTSTLITRDLRSAWHSEMLYRCTESHTKSCIKEAQTDLMHSSWGWCSGEWKARKVCFHFWSQVFSILKFQCCWTRDLSLSRTKVLLFLGSWKWAMLDVSTTIPAASSCPSQVQLRISHFEEGFSCLLSGKNLGDWTICASCTALEDRGS